MTSTIQCPFCSHTNSGERSWRRRWLADHIIKKHWKELVRKVGELNPKYLKRKLAELKDDDGQAFTAMWPDPSKVPKGCLTETAVLSNRMYKLGVKFDVAFWYMNHLDI